MIDVLHLAHHRLCLQLVALFSKILWFFRCITTGRRYGDAPAMLPSLNATISASRMILCLTLDGFSSVIHRSSRSAERMTL